LDLPMNIDNMESEVKPLRSPRDDSAFPKTEEPYIDQEKPLCIGANTVGFADSEVKKSYEEYRNYTNSDRHDTVAMCYKAMHENQTVAHVRSCLEKYNKFGRMEMTIEEAFKLLDNLVDDSDPDSDQPNSFHNFQTAERIRQA